MRQNLTKQSIDEMVEAAKNIFFASDRHQREKKLLREIHPFVYFNERLKTTWGRAWICHSYHPDRHIIGVDKSIERVKVEGRKSWFILEMNPLSQYAPVDEVRDTVSHELAHLLDFRLKGYYTRYHEDHHLGWKNIHLAMGGNGETYGPEHIDLSQIRDKFRNRCHWRG
jgi:predicted SprT family Zn-dependent metalloprotease